MESVSSAEFRTSAENVLLQEMRSHTSVTQSGKVIDNIIIIPNSATDVNLEISAEIVLLQKLLSHTSVTQSGKVKDNIILIPNSATDVT